MMKIPFFNIPQALNKRWLQIYSRSTRFNLKWYYGQKITFIFSSDFETMFIKHSPSEIISLNFEKKTVNLNCNFPF